MAKKKNDEQTAAKAADTQAKEEKAKETEIEKEENEPTAEEKLQKQLDEKNDQLLRMAAEYDNFRRRSREEHAACYESAMADTVAELLGIVDNLERATLYEDGAKVKEGLVMIEKSVAASFEKLGVTEVGKVGDKFDPKLHNAVMHVEDESLGEGEIVEVFQKGYKKGERIIRFAMVKTAN